ncbi:MAG TPA: hypothetical protein VLT33_25580 [Labilithrix sp.]|nr:hypothetical protein [Labilithrix sp.]
MFLADRFQARSVAWFLRLYGLALVVDVATELRSGVWGVHTGALYPWRHLEILPLYPARGLAIEWALRAAAGLALALGARHLRAVTLAVRVLVPVLFVAVLERYSNHGVLLFLIALYLSLAPPDLARPGFDDAPHPALGLVRAQLVIVYVFSALNKLTHGFGHGDSLANLLGLAPGPARLLSWAVIAAELLLPALCYRRPRLGLAGVAVMHAGFALLVPGVWSFGLTMVAMATLFVTSVPAASAERRRR